MNDLFRPWLDRFVVVYLDDILVFSKTLDEHQGHLMLVLEKPREANFKINAKKCDWEKTQVLYLGHVVDGDDVKPEDSKIAAIRDWPTPRTLTELRSSLGLANYYRKFVRNFSTIAAPLRKLLRKETIWKWDKDCTSSMKKLKQALLEYPVLKVADPSLPFVVTTDASLYDIGAVLQQDDGNGYRIVEFMSARMPLEKVATSTYERELYALRVIQSVNMSGNGGASTAAGGFRSAWMTQETHLRAATAWKTKTVLRLTGDVGLTRDLGPMTCPDLTVIGSCKTRSGHPRRCRIDSRKRLSGIIGSGQTLTLDNLELTGFVGTSTRNLYILGNFFHIATISNCLVSGNVNLAGTGVIDLVGTAAVVVKNSQFVRNKGKMIYISYTDLTATNVLFRSNEGGPLISYLRVSVTCVECRFEGNKAAEGAAVLVADYGAVLFSRLSFVGNFLTRVGARGGAVHVASAFGALTARFCNRVFRGNTIALPSGKKMTEHVYLEPTTSHTVSFCKKRPAIGINGNHSHAIDSCEGCPA
ncbi:hypothetical protein CBR_g39438 [Chara braunii]|uniref:Reverse transcriptase domain-containing protein n=1 Tax=Chara braunii TaxID=69332 RepID=A0A388LRU8_CHABU|nr:hypothetical protein CBR_g39438 [Chara braunii]|eukprot:GBG84975.1 hypothetical protein CBR_g39438 [Chara braunii]